MVIDSLLDGGWITGAGWERGGRRAAGAGGCEGAYVGVGAQRLDADADEPASRLPEYEDDAIEAGRGRATGPSSQAPTSWGLRRAVDFIGVAALTWMHELPRFAVWSSESALTADGFAAKSMNA